MVLIGYWPLNEDSGSTAYDYSGNGNNGSISGATVGNSGVLGSAYSFNGDHIQLPVNMDNLYSQFTVSAWVYVASSGSGFRSIVGSSDGTNEFYLRIRSGNTINFGTWNGSSAYEVKGSDLTDGIWTHVVGRKKGNTLSVFLDGELDAQSSVGGFYTNGTQDHIGSLDDGSYHNWNGKLAQIRIYNHALSASEVQYLYSVGKRGTFVSNKRTL